jgi:HAD superfamily hydrolase (TIGR01509 family)
VTASSLVGAAKSDPRIFNSALNDLNVQAEKSIFVDDAKNKTDGARAMGFTSFHLKRKGKCQEDWAIKNLTEFD